jgi:hypothetical protein
MERSFRAKLLARTALSGAMRQFCPHCADKTLVHNGICRECGHAVSGLTMYGEPFLYYIRSGVGMPSSINPFVIVIKNACASTRL